MTDTRADKETRSALERRLAEAFAAGCALEWQRCADFGDSARRAIHAKIAADEIEKEDRLHCAAYTQRAVRKAELRAARKVRDYCVTHLGWGKTATEISEMDDAALAHILGVDATPPIGGDVVGVDATEGSKEVSEPADHGVDRTIGLTGARKEAEPPCPPPSEARTPRPNLDHPWTETEREIYEVGLAEGRRLALTEVDSEGHTVSSRGFIAGAKNGYWRGRREALEECAKIAEVLNELVEIRAVLGYLLEKVK